MADCGVIPRKPRERIISTARDLFRKHGIRGVGVDAIAEAADTNKMTLYRHFGSKDDLVVACLRAVAGEVDAIWSRIESKCHSRTNLPGVSSCKARARRYPRRP